jgi:hypothetical protein
MKERLNDFIKCVFLIDNFLAIKLDCFIYKRLLNFTLNVQLTSYFYVELWLISTTLFVAYEWAQ